MFYCLRKKICLLLVEKCRPFYCILLSPNLENWTKTRYVCSFFVGVCVATVLWWLLLLNLNFSLKASIVILAAMDALIGIGFLFTSSIKCISFLILAGMAGKSGRSYLRALSFAFIISGPIANLAANGGEVVHVFACATTLTYNLTKTRLDLMTKPFQNTLAAMKGDVADVGTSFEKISEILEPMRAEVEGAYLDPNYVLPRRKVENMEEYIQRTYSKKFEDRCKMQLTRGEQRCRGAFAKAYVECEIKLPRIVRTLLCWPFQADFICGMNLLGNPDNLCNPSEVLPNNFGESYAQLDDAEKLLKQNASEVEVKYKIKSPVPQAAQSADRTADLVMEEFYAKKKIFNTVMHIAQMFLSLLFLKLIIGAILYHKKYLGKIDFDNFYISEYFYKIDDRRKGVKKPTILPLKKFEKKNLVDLRRTCQHTDKESKAIIFNLFKFSLEILTAFFFLMLDYSVVTLLHIIRIKSLISYVQEGEHTINFQVQGNGLMARLLRKTLLNFNMHEKVSTYLTNEACLPTPYTLPRRFYLKLTATYAIIIVLIYKSTFFMRLRRLICSYFYRRREKQRVLYLYNNLLRKRRTLFEVMRKAVEFNLVKQKTRRRVNLALRVRLRWPNCCDWLKFFTIARLKCLICDSLEDNDFIICKNPKCRIGYCYQCWREMGLSCISCKDVIKTIEILEFNKFFELVEYIP
ncbi:protein sneaky isoform X2 [Anastrepha obliqua]|uniref:protein sneaky isoform X2 n=1 Tax=Anastrepha obliqua TaxID=95512 RepID=UPI00240995EC|nr:protein sneaky isoform X2 [Anastrepha obliqua]